MNRAAPLLLALAAVTTGCAYYDDGFGPARYDGMSSFDDEPGHGYGSGWYDGFWYPGGEQWIYDARGNRRPWRDRDRDWWRHHRGDRPGTGRPPPRGWEGRPPRPDRDTRPPRWRDAPGTVPPRWRDEPGTRPPRDRDTARPDRPHPAGDAARPAPRERPAPSFRAREPNPNERPD